MKIRVLSNIITPEDTNNKICTKSNNTAQRNNVASNDAMEWCNYIIWNYIYVIPIFCFHFFFVVMLMRSFIKAINSISVIIILLSHINYYLNCLWKYACKGAKYQSSLVFVILSSLDHQQTTLKNDTEVLSVWLFTSIKDKCLFKPYWATTFEAN